MKSLGKVMAEAVGNLCNRENNAMTKGSVSEHKKQLEGELKRVLLSQ